MPVSHTKAVETKEQYVADLMCNIDRSSARLVLHMHQGRILASNVTLPYSSMESQAVHTIIDCKGLR